MRRFVGVVGLLLCVVGSVVGIVGASSPASAQVPGPDVAVSITPTYPATGLPFVRRGESVQAAVDVVNVGDVSTGAVSVRILTTRGFQLDTVVDAGGFTCGPILYGNHYLVDCATAGPIGPGAADTIVVRGTVVASSFGSLFGSIEQEMIELTLSAKATSAGDTSSANDEVSVSRPRAVDAIQTSDYSVDPTGPASYDELQSGAVTIQGLSLPAPLLELQGNVSAHGVTVQGETVHIDLVSLFFFQFGTATIGDSSGIVFGAHTGTCRSGGLGLGFGGSHSSGLGLSFGLRSPDSKPDGSCVGA